MATMDGDRRGGDSARRRQRIVFMPNFSNPVKDSKKAESRRMVAKWAMVNRPKTVLTPTAPPEAASASSAKSKDRPTLDSTRSKSPSLPPPLTIECISSSSTPLERQDSSFSDTAAPFGFLPSSGQLFDDDTYITTDDDDANGGYINNDFQALQVSHTPATALSAISDPFNCLPVENSRHTQELLYSYLNAHFLSPAITEGIGGRVERVKFYRQSTWFPLVLECKAAMNALVAYMESTPDLPIKARKSDFLLKHVQEAYKDLRVALSNPRTEVDDSICVAVILLMLTAQRIGDTTTFRAHAKGLVQLLDARSKALKRNELLREDKNEKWEGLEFIINGPSTTNLCPFCQNAFLRPESRFSSPDLPDILTTPGAASLSSSSSPTSPINSTGRAPQVRGIGFYDMISCGHLSPSMGSFVEQILIWSTISERVRRDNLSAGVACTHAWVDERLGKRPPLDSAFFFSVRLCLYLCTWLEDSHSCLIVRRMVMAASGAIRNPTLNIAQLLQECPDGLLWLALVLGPFAEEDMQRQWFMCLLARARQMAAPSPTDIWYFDEVVERMSNIFIWTNTMTAGARRFWDENPWDFETATAWMEDPF